MPPGRAVRFVWSYLPPSQPPSSLALLVPMCIFSLLGAEGGKEGCECAMAPHSLAQGSSVLASFV